MNKYLVLASGFSAALLFSGCGPSKSYTTAEGQAEPAQVEPAKASEEGHVPRTILPNDGKTSARKAGLGKAAGFMK